MYYYIIILFAVCEVALSRYFLCITIFDPDLISYKPCFLLFHVSFMIYVELSVNNGDKNYLMTITVIALYEKKNINHNELYANTSNNIYFIFKYELHSFTKTSSMKLFKDIFKYIYI